MRLDFFIHGVRAGQIDFSGNKGPWLTYAADYLNRPHALPLSVRAPLADTPIHGQHLRNWLTGLLPDNHDYLRHLCDKFGVRQPLGLLRTSMGLDCAGAVQFCAEGQSPATDGWESGEDDVTPRDIADYLRQVYEIPTERTWRSRPGTGFSLAGMQPKMALAHRDNGWVMPWGAQPSTHIVKMSRDKDYAHEALVEHLTMRTAQIVGLPVATTWLDEMDGLDVIVVERFDRRFLDTGSVARIHQEDLCQALGRDPDKKYQHQEGPRPDEIANLLRRTGQRASGANVERFADLLLYQWATASSDGHAKNFSVLHLLPDTVELAPGYDIASWLPYHDGHFTDINLAMKMGDKRYRIGASSKRNRLARLASELGLSPRHLIGRAGEIAARIPAAMDSAIEELPLHYTPLQDRVEFFRTRVHALAHWAERVAVQAASDLAASAQGGRLTEEKDKCVVNGTANNGAPKQANSSRLCGHIGVRSRKPCVRAKHHGGQHRYA